MKIYLILLAAASCLSSVGDDCDLMVLGTQYRSIEAVRQKAGYPQYTAGSKRFLQLKSWGEYTGPAKASKPFTGPLNGVYWEVLNDPNKPRPAGKYFLKLMNVNWSTTATVSYRLEDLVWHQHTFGAGQSPVTSIEFELTSPYQNDSLQVNVTTTSGGTFTAYGEAWFEPSESLDEVVSTVGADCFILHPKTPDSFYDSAITYTGARTAERSGLVKRKWELIESSEYTTELLATKLVEDILAANEPDWGRGYVYSIAANACSKTQSDIPNGATNAYRYLEASGGTADQIMRVGKLDYRIAVAGTPGTMQSFSYVQRFESISGSITDTTITTNIFFESDEVHFITGTLQPPPLGQYGKSWIDLLPENGSSPCVTCLPGSGDINAGSVDIRIHLGTTAYDRQAGALLVHEVSPTATLGTVGSLKFANGASQLIADAQGRPRQIKTTEVIVDIQDDITVTSPAKRVKICFYRAGQGTLVSGLYTFGSNTPFTTWEIEDPDGLGETVHVKEMTTYGGTTTKLSTFEWVEENNNWTLTKGGGARVEVRKTVAGPGVDETTESLEINDGSVVRYFESSVYKTHAAPSTLGRKLQTRTVGLPADVPLTTAYTYYEDVPASDRKFGKVKTITENGQRWQFFDYDPVGRLVEAASQFNDLTLAQKAQSRVIAYSYEQSDPADDVTVDPTVPRTTTTTLGGLLVAKEKFIADTNKRTKTHKKAQKLLPVEEYLTTVIEHETSGPGVGRVRSIVHPNGVAERFTYEVISGKLRVIKRSGITPATTAFEGFESITDTTTSGQTAAHTVTYIKPGAANVLVTSEAYSNPDALDPFGRFRTLTTLDQQQQTFTYECCGLRYTTDKDGVQTEFGFNDVHDRIESVSRNGVKLSYEFDAAGNVLKIKRYPVAGAVITLKTFTYDTAGRLRSEKDAVNPATTYAPSATAPYTEDVVTYPERIANELGQVIIARYQDGSIKSVSGSAAQRKSFTYSVRTHNADNVQVVRSTSVTTAGAETEWQERLINASGQLSAILTPKDNGIGSDLHRLEHNSKGQISKEIDADGRVTFYKYDLLGVLQDTIRDRDLTTTTEDYTKDRVARVIREYGFRTDGGAQVPVMRLKHLTFSSENSNVGYVYLQEEFSTDGKRRWITRYNSIPTATTVVEKTEVAFLGGTEKVREITTTAADQTQVVQRYEYGRLVKTSHYDSATPRVLLAQEIYQYDDHGRLWKKTDLRNGTTTLTYTDNDLLLSVTTPPPDSGAASQTVSMKYDARGWLTNRVFADLKNEYRQYYPNGLLRESWGDFGTPTTYAYDSQGRIESLRTYKAHPSLTGSSVTRRTYNPFTGRLENVEDPLARTIGFKYWPSGRLKERTNARNQTASFTYSDAGDLFTVTYADGGITPNLEYTYDRRGLLDQVEHGSDIVDLAYNDQGQIRSELEGALTAQQIGTEWTYDSLNRRGSVGIIRPGVQPVVAAYTPAPNSSRLKTVTFESHVAEYQYTPNAPSLVSQVSVHPPSATAPLVTHETGFDFYGRLNRRASKFSSSYYFSSDIDFDLSGHRSAATLGDGSAWSFTYDGRKRLSSSLRRWADGSLVPGQQFTYSYNDSGARLTSGRGGDEWGSNRRVTSYEANLGHQYSKVVNPKFVDVIGEADQNAAVDVNGLPTLRKGGYYRAEVPTVQGANPAFLNANVRAALPDSASNTEKETQQQLLLALPAATETGSTLAYDLDGNVTADSLWTYAWDTESRLVVMESNPSSVIPNERKRRLEFQYDYAGRRKSKVVRTWDSAANGGAGAYSASGATTIRYVYDGLRPIAEMDANNALLRVYVWGQTPYSVLNDAEATLLMVKSYGAQSGAFYAHTDTQDNVAGLVNSADGSIAAWYEYGPFGEAIRANGSMALENPIRFSSKLTDIETGLSYFGARYYHPRFGVWLSKDPIAASHGGNLYAFCLNSPVNFYDPDGRDPWAFTQEALAANSLRNGTPSLQLKERAVYVQQWVPGETLISDATKPAWMAPRPRPAYYTREYVGSVIDASFSPDPVSEAIMFLGPIVAEEAAITAGTAAVTYGTGALARGFSRFVALCRSLSNAKKIEQSADIILDAEALAAAKPGLDKSWKALIEGTAQKTGTAGHQFRTYREAINMAKSGEYSRIRLDRAFSTTDEVQSLSRRRPDILGIRRDGRVDAVEVPSKTDDPGALFNRNWEVFEELSDLRRGDVIIAPIR